MKGIWTCQFCTVDGCSQWARVGGLCRRHAKLRAGKAVRVPRNARLEFLMDVVAKPRVAGCILFPFGTDRGYATVQFNGRSRGVHAVVCELAHGLRPSSRHHAAHSCAVKRCVNPRHLRWALPVENARDAIRHGTQARGERQGSAKLTEAAVRLILSDSRSLQDIAAEYGISKGHVSALRNGHSWSHLSRR